LKEVLGARPATTFAADDGANTLIVAAPAEELAKVREIITKVDTPRADTERHQQLRIFQLRKVEPDRALEAALRLVFGAGAAGNFALDTARKSVIVWADEPTTQAVEALLTRLEDRAPGRPAQDVQVRVVWLVSGPAREDAAAPPADLREVLPALAKLGIDKPQLAAQAVVSVTPNAQFQAKGVAKVDTPCPFAVTGRFGDKKESPVLEVSIRAARKTPGGEEEVCNLQTEITAPPGHLVVLGMTPTGNTTSVFVVQVSRKDAGPPK
jgi:hypothetical protein